MNWSKPLEQTSNLYNTSITTSNEYGEYGNIVHFILLAMNTKYSFSQTETKIVNFFSEVSIGKAYAFCNITEINRNWPLTVLFPGQNLNINCVIKELILFSPYKHLFFLFRLLVTKWKKEEVFRGKHNCSVLYCLNGWQGSCAHSNNV